MESNLLQAIMVTISSSPIPSIPMVFILSSHHHSMLMLLNQPSEAKAAMSNPHFLCFIEFILIIMNHWTLSLRISSNPQSQSTIWDLCSLHNPTNSWLWWSNPLTLYQQYSQIDPVVDELHLIHLHSHRLSEWSEHNSYTVMTMNTIDSKEKHSW